MAKNHVNPNDSWPKVRGPKRKQPRPKEMIAWAVEQWVEDGTISVNGRGGMAGRVADHFGRGLRYEQLIEAKQEADLLRKEAALKQEREDLRVQAIEEREAEERRAAVRARLVEERRAKREADAAAKAAEIERELRQRRKESSNAESNNVVPIRRPEAPVTEHARDGRGRTVDDARVRYAYARQLLIEQPDAANREIIPMVRERFGRGISPSQLRDIRKELGQGYVKRSVTDDTRSHQRRVLHGASTANQAPPKSNPPPPQPVVAAPAPRRAADPEQAIRTAIQLLLDEVPGLETLTLSIDPDGTPHVAYQMRVVRSGNVTLKD